MLNFHLKFGILTLPVKLDAAARPDTVPMKMIAPDGGPVRQQLVSKQTGLEVSRDDCRKGFEVSSDVLVEIPAEELKALEPEAGKAIEIAEFVPAASVDPLHLESSYYLTPDHAGVGLEGYSLLYAALQKSGMWGVGKAVMHGREHVVLVAPGRTGLILYKAYFAAEIRATREFRVDVAAIEAKKLDMAIALVKAGAVAAFEPSKYRDEYTEKLRALVASKAVAGSKVAHVAQPQPDIMEVMRASLVALGASPEPKPAVRARKRKQEPVVSLLDQIVAASERVA